MADDFNEDDFEEYNPHPYVGGYDIARTYGSPLPPSPAICYPISSPAPSAPPLETPTQPRPPDPPAPLSAAPPPHPPGSVHADSGYPWYGYPLPESCSGFTLEQAMCFTGDAEEQWYWRQLKRAGDYLFGYSQGYGERRIGVDSFGIPVYAEKKHDNEVAVSVQFQPASDQRLDFFEESSNWFQNSNYYEGHGYRGEFFSSYKEKGERHLHGSPVYAYDKHYHEQPLRIEYDPFEHSWLEKVSYDDTYGEQLTSESLQFSSAYEEKDERHLHGSPVYVYEKHYQDEPLRIEYKPVQHSWSENESYNEVYGEQLASESHGYLSAYGEWASEMHGNENSYYRYDRHCDEQHTYGELEPYQPTWSQYPSYFEAYKEEVPSKLDKDDDPRETVAEFFSPFQKYSGYND